MNFFFLNCHFKLREFVKTSEIESVSQLLIKKKKKKL